MLEFILASILIPICKIMDFFEKKTELTTPNGKHLKYIPTECAKIFEKRLAGNNDRLFYTVNNFTTDKGDLVQYSDVYLPDENGKLVESAILLADYLMPFFDAENHFIQFAIGRSKGKVEMDDFDRQYLEEALRCVYGKPVKLVKIDDPDFVNGSNEDLIIQDEITGEHLVLNRKTTPEKHTQQNQTNQKIKSTPKSSNKKINLQSCTEDDLLTLEGFDVAKAKMFIKERIKGKVYYDIETFATDFNLQPHQVLSIQDRLIFARRVTPKRGRTIEF